MYGESKPPISSGKLLIILLVAIVVVMLATVALNGGTSSPVEENVSDEVDSESGTQVAADYKLLGNNSYGSVTKSSGYGNPSSDIHVAFILGVDAKKGAQNSIVTTLQSLSDLKYCYDVYLIDTTSSGDGTDSNNQSNLTVNEKSESLASEYVVPDVVNTNYNFTVDIHSTNDSNSYLFVPSENTYTSKKVLEEITNNTNVGKYTPDKHSYTDSVSKPIISYEIPSIVYVTRDYYANGTSSEIASIIQVIDNFDFVGLFSSDSSSDDNGNTTSNNTITVSSTSSGNKEVN